MNTKRLIFFATLASSAAFSAYGDKVSFEQLPAAAQNAIRAQAGSARVEDIDLDMRNGRSIYEAAFKRNGQTTEFRVDQQGRFVDADGNPITESGTLLLKDLPPGVQQAIQARAPQANIQKVDREVKNGEINYVAAFNENGQRQELRLNNDGKMIADVSSPQAVAFTGQNVALSSVTLTPFNSVPWRVQHAIQAQAGLGYNQPVMVGTWQGQPIYQVSVNKDGSTKVMQFTGMGQDVASLGNSSSTVAIGAPAGAVTGTASSSQPGTPNVIPSRPTTARGVIGRSRMSPPQISAASKVRLDETPAAVQQALNAAAHGALIEDIDKGALAGKTVYQAAFKENGRNVEIQVDETGKILFDPRDTRHNRNATAAQSKQVQLSGSQKIDFAQVPAAVRDSVLARTGGAPVEDIEHGTWNGKNVYEAAFKYEGKTVELQVAEDGTIVYDPRNTAVGAAGTAASGAASSKYADVKSNVNLSASSKLSLTEAPAKVQEAFRQQLGSAQLEDLERGTWNGHTVYEGAFKNNGKTVELQVDENGDVVFDPRTQK